MTSRVGPKGQVVIPKAMRDRLGLVPGDEVQFELEDRAVLVQPVALVESFRGRFAALPLIERLEADRRRERLR